MLPSLSKLDQRQGNIATVSGRHKADSLTYGCDPRPTEPLAVLRSMQATGDVSYSATLKDAFDAYAAIVLYAKSMSGYILRLNRKRPDAVELFKESVERSGAVWTETMCQVLQGSLDREDTTAWSSPLGYEAAHHWMAALFLFLNSTALPEITTELQTYVRVPTSDDERRSLVETLLKYNGSWEGHGPQPSEYLDQKLLRAIYEHRVVDFDVALKKRLASNLDHLLDEAFCMFGVSLDVPTILFRADNGRKNQATDVPLALQELSATVVSTSVLRNIDEQFCGIADGATSPCIVYEFHVAAGTRVLPVTVDHPFLGAPLIQHKFLAYTKEREVLLPKGLTYELRSTEAKPGKTRLGRSTAVYSVDVWLR